MTLHKQFNCYGHAMSTQMVYMCLILLVITVPLQADRQNGVSEPLITIGRLSSPVKIDGKLSDACWRDAALMEGFTCIDKQYPNDMTQARMAYDDENLYIAVECQQRILDVVLQQLSAFAKKVKTKDGSVHHDDSVEIFLAPDRGTYFHLMFNALGVKYDAKGTNKKWNGKWVVASRIENGKWTAEVKIPLQEIGIQSGPGKEFNFNICRNQQVDSEISSWVPVSSGFHDVEEFARCRMAKSPVVVRADSTLKSLTKFGKISDLKLSVSPHTQANQKARVKLVALGKKKTVKTRSIESIDGKYSFPLVFTQKANYRLQYEVIGDKGEILFRSPSYLITQKPNVTAKVLLESGVLSKVTLNGIQQESCDGELVLKKGVNNISLECDASGVKGGQVKGELLIAPSLDTPELRIPIDDKWQMKKLLPTGNKILLSRKVAAKTSFFHPVVRENKLHIAHGISQHAPIIVVNPCKQKMEQLKFIMEVPKGLELVGIEDEIRNPKTAYPSNGRLRKVTQQRASSSEDAQCYVFEFDNVKAFRGGADWKNHIHAMVFRLNKEVKVPLNVHYRIEGKTKGIPLVETWNTLTVVPLKTIKIKRPQKISTVLWHGFRTGGYNSAETKALVRGFADVGFNGYIDRTSAHQPKVKLRSAWLNELHRNRFFIIMEIGVIQYAKELSYKYPKQLATNFEGKRALVRIKPEFLLNEARPLFVEHIKDVMMATGAHASLWDLELTPFRVCDTSESTRKKFAEFANLKEVPTASQIKRRYRKQWIAYMCNVWSRVAQIYRDGTKAAGKNKQAWLYSSHPGEIYKARYGIDWSLMKGIVDVAAMGYDRPSRSTLKVLDGQAKFSAAVLDYDGSLPNQYRSLKTRLLRGVAEGADGVSLFNWVILDGRSYTLISEAINLISAYESFFLHGKHTKPLVLEGHIPVDDLYLFEYKNEKLLLVFNPSSKGRKTVIDLGKKRHVDDFYTGQKSSTRLLDVTVSPRDVKAYLIK